ncbi:pectate lyase [Ferruginibacter sp. SUN106]|uniref:pectate lyase n=1 Tax=Ferruginibacter sp. SUN106 TaxID=2978348 RepID=UPI003D35ABDF
MRYIFFLLALLAVSAVSKGQGDNKKTVFDLSIFNDASNHWYAIPDKGTVIMPRPGHPRYKADEITAIADNILLYQKDNGGWPKNYDMQAILTPEQQDSLVKAKAVLNTTFDNRTTYSHISYLSKTYSYTTEEKYKTAAVKGLEYILKAQYNNGGWPQYYPLEEGYSRHITYNDDAFGGIMLLLKDIAEDKQEYRFIDAVLRVQLQKAYDKGLDCILKTQINDAGKPTAWCQQYDETTLQPAWARKFEPPSICNGESVEVVLLLMSIKRPSAAVIDAVQNAVVWFNESKINGIKVETFAAPEMVTPFRISKTDKRVVNDSTAPAIWTRYYELKTHRPLFCNRDSKVVYSLAEVERERRDGYAWYTYEPQKVLQKYPQWQQQFAPGKNVLHH